MTKYDVRDEATINASSEILFNAIVQTYDNTDKWWLPSVSSKLLSGKSSAEIGAVYKVTIHAILPISFIAKTVEVKQNELLKVIYIKGAFKGEGTWEFKPNGNKTLVSFRWQTNPGNTMIKLIAPFVPIVKNHSMVMQQGFKSLKKNLALND